MRYVVVIAAAGLGALFGVGCLIAILFELQGFGAPRDSDPRALYLFSLGLGLAVCVAGPLALWRLLFPDGSVGWGVIGAVVAVIVVLSLVGVSLA